MILLPANSIDFKNLANVVANEHQSSGKSIEDCIVEASSKDDLTQEEIITDKNGHLMGALGVAILAKKEKEEVFNFDILDLNFETKGYECHKCPNKCEIIAIKKDQKIIDAWGNRCEKGALI